MNLYTKIFVLGLTVATVSVTGCSSMSQSNKRLVGTGVGAAAGGIIGDAVFGSPIGMIGGAVAGGVAGNVIGDHSK